MRLHDGDYVASVARIAAEDLKRAGAKVNGDGSENEEGQQTVVITNKGEYLFTLEIKNGRPISRPFLFY